VASVAVVSYYINVVTMLITPLIAMKPYTAFFKRAGLHRLNTFLPSKIPKSAASMAIR
jgi:hypothetical protein